MTSHEELAEEYGLESMDPELETMLEEGVESLDSRVAAENGKVRCIFDLKENGTDPYQEFSDFLDDHGYDRGDNLSTMGSYIAELDPEGLEKALQQPYITAARADKLHFIE
jgi:hypothetical protein